jgi:hypothetical protein
LIIPVILKADLIYSPYNGNGTALSLECIGSYELPFTKYNTINFWGGFGAVSMITVFKNPAFGAELGFEFRQYFKNKSYENFNLGFYSGIGFMRHPYFYRDHQSGFNKSIGFITGLKLTYKKRINNWLIGEPYIGVSIPWYSENINDLFYTISHYGPGRILTIGLRVGINKVRIK